MMSNQSMSTKPEEGDKFRTLRDLLTPIFRHQRITLAVFGGVLTCALLVAWLVASQYYVAQMQVVVDHDRTDPSITSGQNAVMANNKGVTPDEISSEVALLKGQDMLRRVAETCGLADKWSAAELFLPKDPARIKAARIQTAARALEKGVKVEAEKASDVITVRYGSIGDPQRPACVLQNLGKVYLEKHLQLRRPVGSTTFFADQTEKYREELANVEGRLRNFSRDEGFAAPDVLRTDLAQQVTVAMAGLHQAQEQIAADQERIKAAQEQLEKTPERITTQQSSNAASLLLQQLEETLLSVQLKRTQLLVKYDPSFPLVREADEEIAKTQKAITDANELNYANHTTDRDPTYDLLRADLARTHLDLAAQRANASAIATSIQTMRLQMIVLDGKAVKQTSLLREAKADEVNYLLYLNKREQERTADALDQKRIADVAIAVPADVPALPAFNPLIVAIGGLILAVLASFAAGFAAEWLDPSFRTPLEVSEVLKMPVLAYVPRRVA
jgi:uncharacterized protein involved in exopolysaccharide biosynthesis